MRRCRVAPGWRLEMVQYSLSLLLCVCACMCVCMCVCVCVRACVGACMCIYIWTLAKLYGYNICHFRFSPANIGKLTYLIIQLSKQFLLIMIHWLIFYVIIDRYIPTLLSCAGLSLSFESQSVIIKTSASKCLWNSCHTQGDWRGTVISAYAAQRNCVLVMVCVFFLRSGLAPAGYHDNPET